jgi:chromosome segregation ATPase
VVARISISLSDLTLIKVDNQANKRGLSRSAWIANAVESTISGENQIGEELHSTKLALNKAETDIMQLNRQIANLNNQLQEKDKTIESSAREINLLQIQLKNADDNLQSARQDKTNFELTMKTKQSEVEFLRSHIAQLTQSISQLALPPSQEEARSKHWWRFWK